MGRRHDRAREWLVRTDAGALPAFRRSARLADGWISVQNTEAEILHAIERLTHYRNEYGRFTDRPLIYPAADPRAAILPEAADAPGRRDLGRNGSYLVFRQLAQDVPGFWQFLDRQAEGLQLGKARTDQIPVVPERFGDRSH